MRVTRRRSHVLAEPLIALTASSSCSMVAARRSIRSPAETESEAPAFGRRVNSAREILTGQSATARSRTKLGERGLGLLIGALFTAFPYGSHYSKLDGIT